MTISSVVPVNNYAGNGSARTFDFDFLIEQNSELVVTKTDKKKNMIILEENKDYSIHEIGNNSGSYITFPLPGSQHSVLESDEVLTLALTLDIKQESAFPQDMKVFLPVIERTFDYVVRLIQILNRKLERAVKVQENTEINTDELVENIDKIILSLSALININENIQDIKSVNDNEENINSLSLVANAIEETARISPSVEIAAQNSQNITTCANNIDAVNNASNNAIIAQTQANQAKLSAISANNSSALAKSWAVKLNTPVEGGDYSSKYYALISRDITGTNFKELNSNIGYIRGRDILDDVRLFSDISQSAHSTFDLSKFTVVGNPNITDDGIVISTSANNYFYVTDFNSTLPNKFTLNFKVKTPAELPVTHTWTALFLKESEDNNARIYTRIDGNTSNWSFGYKKSDNTYNNKRFADITTNTLYDITIDVDGSNITFKVNDEVFLSGDDLKIDTAVRELYVGSGVNSEQCWENFDLKTVKYFIDGVPAFSGNKTGLDTIKGEDYTVVGTPTISADGIVSGFSGSDYLNLPITINNDTDIVIKGNFTYASLTGRQWLFSCYNASAPNESIQLVPYDDGGLYVRVCIGTNQFGAMTWNETEVPRTAGATYNFEIRINGTNASATINGVTKSRNDFYPFTSTNFHIGESINNFPFLGSTDLNAFKIYIDGNLVYRPCLKIPYTESSTGSKVVDVAYRSRVQDVYEQFGSALYYTIDETNKNVTLPFGEVYGFIEENKKNISENSNAIETKQTIGDWCNTAPTTTSTATQNKPAVVVENYLNGKDGYRVWSDGMIEQWGYAATTSPSGSTQTVNLFKQYSNDDYCVLLAQQITSGRGHLFGTTAVTTSSFTFSQMNAENTGATVAGIRWKTVGY